MRVLDFGLVREFGMGKHGRRAHPRPPALAADPRPRTCSTHILASTFDDALATAWSPSPEPQAQALVRGIASLIESITEQLELDIVLCDLGSSLGPLCHAVAMTVDAIVVPLTPRIVEDAALRSLAGILRRWRDAPLSIARSEPYRTLGFVIVRPSGAIEMQLDQFAAAYHRELSGDLLGTIKEFSSLASIARLVHKPEIELGLSAHEFFRGTHFRGNSRLRKVTKSGQSRSRSTRNCSAP